MGWDYLRSLGLGVRTRLPGRTPGQGTRRDSLRLDGKNSVPGQLFFFLRKTDPQQPTTLQGGRKGGVRQNELIMNDFGIGGIPSPNGGGPVSRDRRSFDRRQRFGSPRVESRGLEELCIRTLGVLDARSKRFPEFRFEKLYGVRLVITGS